VGDEHHGHRLFVTERIEACEEVSPRGEGKHIALAVTNIFDVADAALATDFGQDQAFEPVEGIDDNRSIRMVLDVERLQRLDRVGVGGRDRELVAVDLAQPVLGLDENWPLASGPER
jgi:hypothetical protein